MTYVENKELFNLVRIPGWLDYAVLKIREIK